MTDSDPETPLVAPTPLAAGRVDPRRGLQFGIGFPSVNLRSEALGLELEGGKLTETGALVTAEFVFDPWRVGYSRQIYRAIIPDGATVDGQPIDRIGIDSDQLWGFHGFRPHHSLYLGYGLGVQRRLIRLVEGNTAVAERRESAIMAGLLADWALALPFSLQVRVLSDLQDGFVEIDAASLQLAFIGTF